MPYRHATLGLGLLALALASASLRAEPSARRHDWRFELAAGYTDTRSPLSAWPDGGYGKLRRDAGDPVLHATRAVLQYRGDLAPTLTGQIVLDYEDDATRGLDVTEAFLTWRPLPSGPTQHQLRIGAFYPPLSLENVETAWTSPYTLSYSAINTWLGEELRPLGLEWSLRRRLGGAGSPHQIGAFASAFYGSDPAGTLLFWRGWSLHDRQTRLDDTLGLPPSPIWGSTGSITGTRAQTLTPLREIDDRAGLYGGIEWRYARRMLLQLAHYDNRADPYAYARGQWAWGTSFDQVAAQLALPARLGLIVQWMRGNTRWVTGAGTDGRLSPAAALVDDGFEASFLLLTRALGEAHRVALRYDDFAILRAAPAATLASDGGHAWTLAYRYLPRDRLVSFSAEWLEIASRRTLWSEYYDLPSAATERQLRVEIGLRLTMRAR